MPVEHRSKVLSTSPGHATAGRSGASSRFTPSRGSHSRRSGTAMALSPYARMTVVGRIAPVATIFLRARAPTAPQSQFVVRDAVKLHHLDWGNQGRHPLVL